MAFQRPQPERFIVERLPDGSAVVFDRGSEAVHSLNATAVIAWECCVDPATVDEVAEALGRATGAADTQAAAEDALNQLVNVGLIESTGAAPVRVSSRRQALRIMLGGAAIAAPVILTMTLTEQHALAQGTGSPTPTPTPLGPTAIP